MSKKQSGFSLIEVIIAGAIMTGMALFMFDMSSNMQKISKDMEERVDIIQRGRELETLLASKQYCSDSLTGLDLENDEITIRIQNKDSDGNFDGTYTEKFSANLEAQDLAKNFSKLTLSHLEYENIDLPTDGNGKFYINYQFRKSEGSPFSKRYKVLVHARAADGKIETCFSTPEEVIKAITENVCQALG